jgi:hypothetical protein
MVDCKTIKEVKQLNLFLVNKIWRVTNRVFRISKILMITTIKIKISLKYRLIVKLKIHTL